jgi:hypothetical protein
MTASEDDLSEFDQAAERVVELGNQIMAEEEDADSWDVASGLLAGAVQFWLYTRQPCGDPTCDSCADISTAAERLHKMLDEVKEFAEESDYFHSPRDSNVGTA